MPGLQMVSAIEILSLGIIKHNKFLISYSPVEYVAENMYYYNSKKIHQRNLSSVAFFFFYVDFSSPFK